MLADVCLTAKEATSSQGSRSSLQEKPQQLQRPGDHTLVRLSRSASLLGVRVELSISNCLMQACSVEMLQEVQVAGERVWGEKDRAGPHRRTCMFSEEQDAIADHGSRMQLSRKDRQCSKGSRGCGVGVGGLWPQASHIMYMD